MCSGVVSVYVICLICAKLASTAVCLGYGLINGRLVIHRNWCETCLTQFEQLWHLKSSKSITIYWNIIRCEGYQPNNSMFVVRSSIYYYGSYYFFCSRYFCFLKEVAQLKLFAPLRIVLRQCRTVVHCSTIVDEWDQWGQREPCGRVSLNTLLCSCINITNRCCVWCTRQGGTVSSGWASLNTLLCSCIISPHLHIELKFITPCRHINVFEELNIHQNTYNINLLGMFVKLSFGSWSSATLT